MAMFTDQLRQVLRRLGRAPLFTAITLLTLAIGVGANTVIFSVIEGVLLKPLPYPHPEQLIGVWHTAPGINIKDLNMSPSIYFIDREQNTTLQDIGVYDGDSFDVTGAGEPEHVRGLDVTHGTLPLLGVVPAIGRLFTRSDDSPGAQATVLLSHGYWQKKFGGDRSVIGRSITVDGKPRQIIGVLPQSFHFLDWQDAAIVAPFQWDRGKIKLGNFSQRALARMKPGVTIEQASVDMGRLLPVVLRSFPAPEGFSVSVFEKAHIAPNLRPLKQDVVGDIGKVLWVLMGSIALVLLVACANVANLLLVRVEGRRQELAIRSALGAGWGRIAGELLFESIMLGVAGSLIGLALAYATLRVLVAAAPTGLPRIHEIGIDPLVLLFTLGLALFISLLIGSIPVIKYAGASLNSGLREGGRALSQSRERHRARKALVIVQVSLALVLLICSGLMIRTFRALMHVSPGFDSPDTIQTFRFYIPDTQIPDKDRDRIAQMQQAILDKLSSIPGVSSAAFTTAVPLDGYDSNDILYAQDHMQNEGELPPSAASSSSHPASSQPWAQSSLPAAISPGPISTRSVPSPSSPRTSPANIGTTPAARSARESAWPAPTTGGRSSVYLRTFMTTGSINPHPAPSTGRSCRTTTKARNRCSGAASPSSSAARAPDRTPSSTRFNRRSGRSIPMFLWPR